MTQQAFSLETQLAAEREGAVVVGQRCHLDPRQIPALERPAARFADGLGPDRAPARPGCQPEADLGAVVLLADVVEVDSTEEIVVVRDDREVTALAPLPELGVL